MSSEFVRNECPPTCPKVKRNIRAEIEREPLLLDEIFLQKNDDYLRLSPDVIQEFREIQEGVIDIVHKRPIDYHEKIVETPAKAIEDIVEIKPIQEETIVQETRIVEKFPIVQEQAVVERITDRDDEIIDLVKEKIPIVQEQVVIPTEKIVNHDDEITDLVEEKKLPIVQEQAVIPTERIVDRDDEKIDLVKEEFPIVQEQVVIPTERIADRDDEKIDLIKEEELVQDAIIKERAAIPMERIVDDDKKKIDLVKEKELVAETTIVESVKEIPVEKPEIIEDEIERTAIPKIELELPQELEEYFEPEKLVEYGKDEEGITDYEKFIDEELQESLPAVIAKEIPEEPRAMRQEISRNAVYEKIDRDRPADRPSREPKDQVGEEVSAKVKRIISRKPVTADVCDETCPLVKKQKGEQLAYFQEEETSVLSFSEKTLYTQIEGTTAGRRSLLSDKGLQLLRRRMHVLSGLHGVHSEQGSVREKRIRVSRIVCGRIKAVL